MSAELIRALDQLEKERGIEKDVLVEAIEAALVSAYKKNFGTSQDVRVSIDRETGEVKVFALKRVTAEPEDDNSEISLEEAMKLDPRYEEEDIAEIEVTPRKFGRIAAQTAKNVVMQRIREAERNIIYEEFFNKEGDIVTGIIQRAERRNVVIDLGKAEAIMLPSEQTIGEEYRFNDRIKIYIVEVKKTTKGPQIFVSRTHPGLVKRLFELEVPEIHDGTVEIKSISREAGSRTKIAVYSRDPNVDPIGACVGQRGTRVQAIVDELRGEKIDIIKWSSDPEEFISSSLSPAKVVRVDVDEEARTARVIVPDFQLSLAIGKEGQNARLAARLTGWKIDIKSESQLRAAIEQQMFNMDNSYDDEFDEEIEEDYEAVYDSDDNNNQEAYEPETDDIEAESGYDIEAGQDDVDPEQDSEAEQE
ncbi:MAG TPA: transcription termination factor NusA [Clostridiales bacterium]|nr:transcription termination factor NusA [Clostridiales bacterium]HPZ05380.1 transcription termination factor NusA [Clostridiales bacterium]HQD30334.1 transcription termination factor NusA [Clostridiales bacterium]